MPKTDTTKTQTKFVLKTVVEGIKAKHPAIEITAGEKTFTISPPQLWPDEVLQVGDDPVASAKLLLGPQYKDFLAVGGSAAILMQVIAQSQGVEDLGESSAS